MAMLWIILYRLVLTVSAAPNFVFIVADDLGFNDVGWKISTNTYTPILDSLVAKALEINRFYVYSNCSPTRAALWTGRYTHMIGMQDKGIEEPMSCGVEPAADTVFFTEKLKQCNSYKNYFIGKWHLGLYKWAYTPIFRGGLDYFKGNLGSAVDYFAFTSTTQNVYDWRENTNKYTSPSDTYATTAIGNKATEIINTISINNDISPFTLMISFTAPHGPIHESPDHADAVNNGIYAATGASERQQYNGMIRTMDIEINEIITALKTKHVNSVPIWNNTYVFFFSDNGGNALHGSNYPLRGTKKTYFEGGIRAPAFITGGALHNSLQGTAYDKPIHITDIYATLMELANVDTSALTLDGSSFASILNPTQTSVTRDTIIISVNNVQCSTSYNSNQVCGGIIKQTDDTHIYKLVIGSVIAGTGAKYGWVHLDNQNDLPASITNCGSLPQPTFNNAFKTTDCANTGQPCLYNLYSDPCEYTNLATDSAYESVLSTLMSELIIAYDSQVTPLGQTGTCDQHSNSAISDYWNINDELMPFAHFEDASFNKTNTANYTASGVCTFSPTKNPTSNLSVSPTNNPSKSPTLTPTKAPTKSPSNNPTKTPTQNPTLTTSNPTKHPTVPPTKNPTNNPSKSPTENPTLNPSASPSKNPTKTPTKNPTVNPTANPSNNPSKTPTIYPSATPTKAPTQTTLTPTKAPTKPTNVPTKLPSHNPTKNPTKNPTTNQSMTPTKTPSKNPSVSPTENPTSNPSITTKNPTYNPTDYPSQSPTQFTISPSHNPSQHPSVSPTNNPSKSPSKSPTKSPTNNPSKFPTNNPSKSPTKSPSHSTTNNPTKSPSNNPSASPTSNIVIFETTPTKRWIPANNACVDNLVSIKTEADKNKIAAYLTLSITEAWIGLKKISGTFEWTDGTVCDAICTSFWANGQPGGNDCVVINLAGKFVAKPCRRQKAYFCSASGGAPALHNDKRQSEANYEIKAYGDDTNDEKEHNEANKYIYYVYYVSLLIIIIIIIIGCIYIKCKSYDCCQSVNV